MAEPPPVQQDSSPGCLEHWAPGPRGVLAPSTWRMKHEAGPFRGNHSAAPPPPPPGPHPVSCLPDKEALFIAIADLILYVTFTNLFFSPWFYPVRGALFFGEHRSNRVRHLPGGSVILSRRSQTTHQPKVELSCRCHVNYAVSIA